MSDSPIRKAIHSNNLKIELDEHDRKLLKHPAPFICIANQSLEFIDEIVLMELMENTGIPFRIIGREKKFIDELKPYVLPVSLNIIQVDDYVKQVFKHLKWSKENGICVCIVLHFTDNSLYTPVRQEFLNSIMKAVLKVGMPIVPIRIKAPFPDYVRPRIGKMMILKQRKDPYKVFVRIGRPIGLEDQQQFTKARNFRRYLQSKIFSLGSGLEVKPRMFKKKLFQKTEKEMPLAEALDTEVIEREINSLDTEKRIASQGNYDIFVVESKDIPNVLKEIGRLRELTFREVGEGTGKELDLDEYDIHYQQLILWDRELKEIAGGYRMGVGEDIFNRYGANGFYISSLFKISPGFYPIMQSAIELGRSYVVPSHQKKRLPLFLLWKGIIYFLLKNPQYQYLYGPVSISKYYSSMSRGLIVAFIKNYYFDHNLAKYLNPKKPFKAKVDKVDIDLLAASLGDQINKLDSLIEDIEPEHIRIPVLVRQYLKLNARFISFNVDPNFSDVLDGFILLNLKDIPPSMIEALQKEL